MTLKPFSPKKVLIVLVVETIEEVLERGVDPIVITIVESRELPKLGELLLTKKLVIVLVPLKVSVERGEKTQLVIKSRR